jgi:DNA-binding NtrC family response regulator
MTTTRILVADDDPLTCRILRRMLIPHYQVTTCSNGEDALRHFTEQGADILLTDLQMPRMNGLELLAKVREFRPDATVIVITGFSSIDSAVAAVKQGAYDYIAKPFDPDDVLLRIRRALKEKELATKLHLHQRQQDLAQGQPPPLTQHPAMLAVLEMARKVARTDSTVLILGETGVGKELMARLVHQWSGRRDHPFVAVNCSALAEGVLESELFGHERGAFTGAVRQRIGFFELADRGTLLLDEIGTADAGFQAKLLRVLQERSIHRVGGAAAVPVNVRVIAATNQDLETEARTGLFRPDLYFRLNVVTLRLPPLRERREDIALLAQHFIGKYRHINPRIEGLSPAGMERLLGYDYPGNIRELENIVERAMILENGSLLTADSLLLAEGGGGSAGFGVAAGTLAIEEAEKQYILQILEKCQGRKMEAARLLGINKTTLWRKMKKFGLDAS